MKAIFYRDFTDWLIQPSRPPFPLRCCSSRTCAKIILQQVEDDVALPNHLQTFHLPNHETHTLGLLLWLLKKEDLHNLLHFRQCLRFILLALRNFFWHFISLPNSYLFWKLFIKLLKNYEYLKVYLGVIY